MHVATGSPVTKIGLVRVGIKAMEVGPIRS